MAPLIATDFSNTKKHLLSTTAMQRTPEWISPQKIPSDLTVIASEISFSLHKFPLVSKCGYLKQISKPTDSDVHVIEIPDCLGGAKAFELVAKLCYGTLFEINIENVVMLRCAAEYLDMTEEYAVGNLVGRAEAYINEVALETLSGAVLILHSAEKFLQIAEKVDLVNRCIDMIAYIACKDGQFPSTGVAESGVSRNWSGEDLVVLRFDLFQRVLIAMMARGFKQDALGLFLILYAQKALEGLELLRGGRKTMEPEQEYEKRLVLETIVSLLPKANNSEITVSFLSMMLRAAIYLNTTVSCRLELEKRTSLQLEQATLGDILIPSYTITGDTLFDVDTVHRIMMNYLEYAKEDLSSDVNHDQEFVSFPPLSDMELVAKLMERYLAEISSDIKLSVSKFVNLAEMIPKQAMIIEDGMYRAIDIYLKAHHKLSETERKEVFSVLDFRKLSKEACAHAIQNQRLPVQCVVQVLYFDNQRLRNAMGSRLTSGEEVADPPHMMTRQHVHHKVVFEEDPVLKRENQDLKSELVKAKMLVKEMEKCVDKSSLSTGSCVARPQSIGSKPTMHIKSFMSSISRNLGKLYPLFRVEGVGSFNQKVQNKQIRERRHSMS